MNLPAGYTYLEATNLDIPKVRSLIFQVLKEFGLQTEDASLDYDVEDLEKHYQNGYFGVVKNPDNEIIGTFALYQLNESTLEVRKMYLLPKYRGMGIGKWMLHFLIKQAKDRNYSKLELKTASVLRAAIALYNHTGFDEVTCSESNPRCDRAFEMYLDS